MEYIDRDPFGSLELWFYDCSAAASPSRQGAHQILGVLQRAGGVFSRVKPGSEPPRWEVYPNPFEEIQEDGGFYFAEFAHPLLTRSLLEPVGLRQFSPTCAVSYDAASRTLRISQSGSEEEPEKLDALAQGQLALAEKLYPLLKPRLVFIDEASDGLDEQKVLWQPLRNSASATGIPYIFWATFLSPTAVERCGANLFFDAPGWRNEHLPDGGILYVTTESYHRWWSGPPRAVQAYFRSRRPPIAMYNTAWLIAGYTGADDEEPEPKE